MKKVIVPLVDRYGGRVFYLITEVDYWKKEMSHLSIGMEVECLFNYGGRLLKKGNVQLVDRYGGRLLKKGNVPLVDRYGSRVFI